VTAKIETAPKWVYVYRTHSLRLFLAVRMKNEDDRTFLARHPHFYGSPEQRAPGER